VDVFKDKSDVQSLIYYYLAEVNLKIKRYKQAEAMIEEALKLPIEDSHERRDYAIERFMIKTKTETDQLAIQKIYQVILKEIESVILTNGYL
jgi:tetratricopeptide (TPR) repeat protein